MENYIKDTFEFVTNKTYNFKFRKSVMSIYQIANQ